MIWAVITRKVQIRNKKETQGLNLPLGLLCPMVSYSCFGPQSVDFYLSLDDGLKGTSCASLVLHINRVEVILSSKSLNCCCFCQILGKNSRKFSVHRVTMMYVFTEILINESGCRWTLSAICTVLDLRLTSCLS